MDTSTGVKTQEQILEDFEKAGETGTHRRPFMEGFGDLYIAGALKLGIVALIVYALLKKK